MPDLLNHNAKLTEVRWSVTRYPFLGHLMGTVNSVNITLILDTHDAMLVV